VAGRPIRCRAIEVAANKQDWEELAELDPLWAIASTAEQRYGRWDLEEFFATGRPEVDATVARLRALDVPRGWGAALDFGCGVGRATRWLATHFDTATGVDISETMIARARELNADIPNLEFRVNAASDLQSLGDRRFDLVYTRIVLQHVAGRAVARSYVQEFLRVLNPGGVAVFQIPVYIPRRYRIMPIRRLYLVGRRLGLSPGVLYKRLRLHPMRMQWVPEGEIAAWIGHGGGRILDVEREDSANGVRQATFYATR
jgi:SAM-dependent methyltransferase